MVPCHGSAPAESKSESPRATRPSKTGPLWFAAGVCLAVLAYCVAREFWAMAIGCGIGFLAAVGAALAFRSSSAANCPPIGPIGGPYGNGPYRKANCAPSAKIVAVLADITDKIRNLPENGAGDRSLDWQAFDTSRDRSEGGERSRRFHVGSSAIQRRNPPNHEAARQTRPTIESGVDRI